MSAPVGAAGARDDLEAVEHRLRVRAPVALRSRPPRGRRGATPRRASDRSCRSGAASGRPSAVLAVRHRSSPPTRSAHWINSPVQKGTPLTEALPRAGQGGCQRFLGAGHRDVDTVLTCHWPDWVTAVCREVWSAGSHGGSDRSFRGRHAQCGDGSRPRRPGHGGGHLRPPVAYPPLPHCLWSRVSSWRCCRAPRRSKSVPTSSAWSCCLPCSTRAPRTCPGGSCARCGSRSGSSRSAWSWPPPRRWPQWRRW